MISIVDASTNSIESLLLICMFTKNYNLKGLVPAKGSLYSTAMQLLGSSAGCMISSVSLSSLLMVSSVSLVCFSSVEFLKISFLNILITLSAVR